MSLSSALHELKFWKGFIQSERFRNRWLPDKPNTDLHASVSEFLAERPNATVLDVGSGAVSLLRGTVPAAKLHACDLLGGFYELIFDYAAHGIAPPTSVAAERLPWANEFDVVHCSNALDHTDDPVLALAQMIRAAKPGGWVIIEGFEREGSFEGWRGMHRWDLWLDGPHLMLRGLQGGEVDMGTADRHWSGIRNIGREWLVWMRQCPGS